jgi:hypothetical protein
VIVAIVAQAASLGHDFGSAIAGVVLRPDVRSALVDVLTGAYELGLERDHAFLPDLVDEVLQWLEGASDHDVELLALRSITRLG